MLCTVLLCPGPLSLQWSAEGCGDVPGFHDQVSSQGPTGPLSLPRFLPQEGLLGQAGCWRGILCVCVGGGVSAVNTAL